MMMIMRLFWRRGQAASKETDPQTDLTSTRVRKRFSLYSSNRRDIFQEQSLVISH